jgi:uncharacterized protein YoxC
MRFLNSIPLLAVAVAATTSNPIERRDGKLVQKVLSDISMVVDRLAVAVNAFQGDIKPLNSVSADVLKSIQSGIDQIKPSTPLTQDEAINIATFVQGLNTSVSKVVNDIIAKKPIFIQYNAVPDVLKSLQDQDAASAALADAITAKVPAELKELAATLSADINAILKRGIAAFQTGIPPPKSGSSTTPPKGTSTTPPKGTSTTPPKGTSTTPPKGTSTSPPKGTTPVPPKTSGPPGSTPPKTTGAPSGARPPVVYPGGAAAAFTAVEPAGLFILIAFSWMGMGM